MAVGAERREGLQALLERLQSRRPEIEQAILARAYAVDDPTGVGDPAYVEGLRAAVGAAVTHGLSAIESGGPRLSPVPIELLSQARQAARNSVSLDTVLRRYFAGYTLLEDFVMQEAEQAPWVDSEELHRLTRAQATVFDRLVVAVTEEHGRELSGRADTAERRRAECVEGLLAGELAAASELGYELEGWHIGVIAAGPGAERPLRTLAGTLDRRLLLLPHRGNTVWAWLGGRHKVDCADLRTAVRNEWPMPLALAMGEPGQGLPGWRLTHRQAAAALPVALRRSRTPVHYADVSLLASMLQDNVLLESLRSLYLAPLAADRDGGLSLRQTLRAYFAAERNVSSAAAALGCNRHTVTRRLERFEDRLGRPLRSCATEVEAALRLEENV